MKIAMMLTAYAMGAVVTGPYWWVALPVMFVVGMWAGHK